MVFTSHIFVFYFLPLALAGYYLLPRGRNLFLLAVSYVFYGWWEPWFVLLMFIATAINYGCGHIIAAAPPGAPRRKQALAAAVTASLGLLGFFKYFVFVQENLNAALEVAGAAALPVFYVALPIGISFFTFQSMTYAIDVYRGDAPPARSFSDFACFVALFPQLIAGPIVRYGDVAAQLVHREHSSEKFASGVTLFILGFSKKILLANSLAGAADAAFGVATPYPADAWFGAAAYAFQIYYDFSGYSDMAVGLGRMFGFEFIRNFDAPYRSASITEFWRRWHISLSTFLRDYLYIPLGGSRRGERRTYVNLAVVMLLGGLWHGANWTFVCWGGFHGVLLALERALGRRPVYAWLPKPARVLCTFALLLVSWVLFRSADIGAAARYLAAMFGLARPEPGAALLGAMLYTPGNFVTLAVCAAIAAQKRQAWEFARDITPLKAVLVLALFVWALAALAVQQFNPFLYFQF